MFNNIKKRWSLSRRHNSKRSLGADISLIGEQDSDVSDGSIDCENEEVYFSTREIIDFNPILQEAVCHERNQVTLMDDSNIDDDEIPFPPIFNEKCTDNNSFYGVLENIAADTADAQNKNEHRVILDSSKNMNYVEELDSKLNQSTNSIFSESFAFQTNFETIQPHPVMLHDTRDDCLLPRHDDEQSACRSPSMCSMGTSSDGSKRSEGFSLASHDYKGNKPVIITTKDLNESMSDDDCENITPRSIMSASKGTILRDLSNVSTFIESPEKETVGLEPNRNGNTKNSGQQVHDLFQEEHEFETNFSCSSNLTSPDQKLTSSDKSWINQQRSEEMPVQSTNFPNITATQSLPHSEIEILDPSTCLSYRMRSIAIDKNTNYQTLLKVETVANSISDSNLNESDEAVDINTYSGKEHEVLCEHKQVSYETEFSSPQNTENDTLWQSQYKFTPADQKWFSPRKKWSEQHVDRTNIDHSIPPVTMDSQSLPSVENKILNPSKTAPYRMQVCRRGGGGTPLSKTLTGKARNKRSLFKRKTKTKDTEEMVSTPEEIEKCTSEHSEDMKLSLQSNNSDDSSNFTEKIAGVGSNSDDSYSRREMTNYNSFSETKCSSIILNDEMTLTCQDESVPSVPNECVAASIIATNQVDMEKCTTCLPDISSRPLSQTKNLHKFNIEPNSVNEDAFTVGCHSPDLGTVAPKQMLETSENTNCNLPEDSQSKSNEDEHVVYSWAYDVWRRRGLLVDSTKKIPCVSPKISPKLEPLLKKFDRQEMLQNHAFTPSEASDGLARGIGDNMKRQNKVKGRKSMPALPIAKQDERNGNFAHILKQWRIVSDDKPCTHFLSPESQQSHSRVFEEKHIIPFHSDNRQAKNFTSDVLEQNSSTAQLSATVVSKVSASHAVHSEEQHGVPDFHVTHNSGNSTKVEQVIPTDNQLDFNSSIRRLSLVSQNSNSKLVTKLSSAAFITRAQFGRTKQPTKVPLSYKTVSKEIMNELEDRTKSRSKSTPRQKRTSEDRLTCKHPEEVMKELVRPSVKETLNVKETQVRHRSKSLPRLRENSQMAMSLTTLRPKLTKEYSDGLRDDISLSEMKTPRSSMRVIDLLENSKKSSVGTDLKREKFTIPTMVEVSHNRRHKTIEVGRLGIRELSTERTPISQQLAEYIGEVEDGAQTTRNLVESYRKSFEVCRCSSSLFSGNDEMIDFFLPLTGTACACGRRPPGLRMPEEPTSLVNILRTWQVEFLASYGIYRGDELVKAHHRSSQELAKALRTYRKKHNMTAFRTKNCLSALKIWSKTSKAYVRSIRSQIAAGTVVHDFEIPNPVPFIQSLLELGSPSVTMSTYMSSATSMCSQGTSVASRRQSGEGLTKTLREV